MMSSSPAVTDVKKGRSLPELVAVMNKVGHIISKQRMADMHAKPGEKIVDGRKSHAGQGFDIPFDSEGLIHGISGQVDPE